MKLTIKTADDLAAEQQARRAQAIKAEARARIVAVASEMAQINLASAAAAGLLSAADLATYQAGLIWIADTRAAAAALIADRQADWRAEAAWPPVPLGLAALAARY